MNESEKSELVADDASGESSRKSCCKTVKRFFKQFFTHVGLIALVSGYIVLGGYVFNLLEGDTEDEAKAAIKDARQSILETLLLEARAGNVSDEEWKITGEKLLADYESIVGEHYVLGRSHSDIKDWDMLGAAFFSGTVITTIGYGNIVPVTPEGRFVTIIYAIFGIPLMLVALVDIGKLLTRAIKYLWSFVRRFYYTGHCKKVRKGTRQAIVTARHRFGAKNGEKIARVESIVEDDPVYEIDDEFNLPVLVGLLLLVLYLFIGAGIFSTKEEWNYLDAFYFCFISISTIGLGDLVPRKSAYIIAASIYIIIGLSLTSMVINVCQEYLDRKYQEAKQKVHDKLNRFGFSTESSRETSREPPAPVHYSKKPSISATDQRRESGGFGSCK